MPSTTRAFAGRVSAAAVVCAAFVLQGCGSAFPPAPTRATSLPLPASLDTSVVAIPISVRIRNVDRALDRSNPNTLLNSGWRAVKATSDDGFADVRRVIAQTLFSKAVESRYLPTEFRLTVSRGDATAQAQGLSDVIRIAVNDRYKLELNSSAGRYVCNPSAHAALGNAANVVAAIRPDGTLGWNVANVTGRIAAHCEVARSILANGAELDLTDALQVVYARVLHKVSDTLVTVVQRVADLVLRVKFATLATTLAQPIELPSNAWLTPNLLNATVRGLQFGASGNDLLANFNLALAVRPQISLGAPPSAAPATVPRFGDLQIPDGFHLPVDVRAPFSLIEQHARAQLIGTELPVAVIGTVRINNAFVYATDTGTPAAPQPKLVVQIDFSGGASGTLYLWGTPTIDPATRVISMPDLTYTTDTRHLLVRIFAPILTSNWIVSKVQNAATFDASKLIDEQTAPFLKAYDKTITLPDGTTVALHAVPEPLGLKGVALDAEALYVRAVVNGTLNARVDTDADALALLGG
jgi:hypothetical protein